MDTCDEIPDRWAIVEIMGHHKLAGRISEEEMLGVKLLRVDVPETSRAGWHGQSHSQPGYTKFFGAAAIFGIEICTEAEARRVAKETESYNHPVPYEALRLPAGSSADGFDGDDEDEGDYEIVDPVSQEGR